MSNLLSVSEMCTLLDEAHDKIYKSKKFASCAKIDAVRQALRQGAFDCNVNTDTPTVAVVNPPIIPTTPSVKTEAGLEEYIPQNGEVDDSLIALARGKNLCFTGPTGCGKTHLAHWLAHLRGQKIVTVQGTENIQVDDIIGYPTIENENGISVRKYIAGLLPIAMEEGSILYMDEPNMVPDAVLSACFSAMEPRQRSLTLTQDNGRVIKAHPDFRVISAMNEGYSGTHTLNQAFRARSVIKQLQYLPANREEKLLTDRTGIHRDIAAKLVQVATQLRAARQRGEIRTDIGTRSLLDCADLMIGKMSDRSALEMAIIDQVPGNMIPERKAVADAVAAFFPTFNQKAGNP